MSSLSKPANLDYWGWLKKFNWNKHVIGNLWGADISGALMKSWDIVLCGVGGAFVLLIAALALVLPHDLRALVWLGCAFLLVSVVERPSWSVWVAFPLTLMIVTVGSITLAAVLSGFPNSMLIPLSVPFLPLLIGFGVAMHLAASIFNTVLFALTYEPQGKRPAVVPEFLFKAPSEEAREDKRAIRRQLKALMDHAWVYGWGEFGYGSEGVIAFRPPLPNIRFSPESLTKMEAVLERPVALTPNGRILLIHPKAAPEVILHDQ